MKLDYESNRDTKRDAAARREKTSSLIYGSLALCAALAYAGWFILLWLGRG